MTRLVLATRNDHKVHELRQILGDLVGELSLEVVGAGDVPGAPDVAETEVTFEGNARLKAVAICTATGLPAVADDTGLFVDALDGAPGIYAARFAGEDATYADNCAKLLRELADRGHAASRRAEFRTVALVRWPDGTELAVEGICAGRIAPEVQPGRGFGYDSVFIADDGDGRAFSQMSPAEKHEISHRGRAFAQLVTALRAMPTA